VDGHERLCTSHFPLVPAQRLHCGHSGFQPSFFVTVALLSIHGNEVHAWLHADQACHYNLSEPLSKETSSIDGQLLQTQARNTSERLCPRPPCLLLWLQRHGLVLSSTSHKQHHRHLYDRQFCTLTGWANPLLNCLSIPLYAHTNDFRNMLLSSPRYMAIVEYALV